MCSRSCFCTCVSGCLCSRCLVSVGVCFVDVCVGEGVLVGVDPGVSVLVIVLVCVGVCVRVAV